MSDERYPYVFKCDHMPCVCDGEFDGLYRINPNAGKDWQDFRAMLQIMLRDGALVPVKEEDEE